MQPCTTATQQSSTMATGTDRRKSSTTAKAAPTNGPGTKPGPLSPGGLGIGGGPGVQGFLLSARTCIELLSKMTEQQINTELAHLEAIDASVHAKLSNASVTTRNGTKSQHLTIDRKRDVLRESLCKTLISEVDKIVGKYDSLVQSLHRSLDDAEQKLTSTAQQLTNSSSGPSSSGSSNAIQQGTSSVGNITPTQTVEAAVRFAPLSFTDIPYNDVESSFAFNQTLPGNRCCVYYGDIGYSYGNIKHQPAKYPAASVNSVLDRIFDEISVVDSSFTRDNFSCLVTHYKNGSSSINMHSDDERVIAPGSNIYMVSFGAERTARFYNVVGALQNEHHTLKHGSVHIMTQSS